MTTLQAWTALLALSAAAGCSKNAAANTAAADAGAPRVEGDRLILRPNDPQLAGLTTATVVEGAADSLRLPGRLVWNEDVTVRVFSPFAGRVARVIGDVGRRVRQQDTLALIVSPDYGQAQADARRAATDFAFAQRTAARVRDLFQHGVAAQKDVEAADADLERTRSELRRARSRLASYGADSTAGDQLFALRAPLGGRIVERSITPGQEVRPDQMLANAPQLFAPLFVVTDPSQLWVILDVPERELPVLSAGAALAVHANAWPGRTFPGRLTLVGGAVDPASRTLKVRGTVDNAQGTLKSEMLVTVTLPSLGASGMAVPASAVVLQGANHVVYVDEGGGRLRRAAVTVGAERQGSVAVLSGLAAGERVVTNGALLVEQLFQESKTHS
jgi:cobalt-zinc-cadmium efflux system membrane fusion protein